VSQFPAVGLSNMWMMLYQVVDDFSSKIGLPPPFERIETLDTNHRQMARCKGREDLQYRAILAVLKQFIRGSNEIKARVQAHPWRLGQERTRKS
jgi:hypothetical protein